jgi:hypothetical protein
MNNDRKIIFEMSLFAVMFYCEEVFFKIPAQIIRLTITAKDGHRKKIHPHLDPGADFFCLISPQLLHLS